jgi:hypothetical protein
MGGACGTCEEQERLIQGFLRGKLSERDLFENLGVDGSLILA